MLNLTPPTILESGILTISSKGTTLYQMYLFRNLGLLSKRIIATVKHNIDKTGYAIDPNSNKNDAVKYPAARAIL